jgi:DNA-binding response OmpR family regulator
MSSTLGSASDQRKGFAAGVDEYVAKPVNIPDLLSRIERIFKKTLVGRENVLIVEPDLNIARNITKRLKNRAFHHEFAPPLRKPPRYSSASPMR